MSLTDTHKFYLAVLTAVGAIIGNVAQAVRPQQQPSQTVEAMAVTMSEDQ